MGLREFRINIIGLSNKMHHFQYEIGDAFFRHYGTDLISEGSFVVDLSLDKHETFIEAGFLIKGNAKLICDRSLDPFQYPVRIDKKILFKYGEATEELSDEIMMIHRDADSIEIGQYIYEFISLAIPIKKLHPRYQEEDWDEAEGKIIYRSGAASPDNASEENIDPRWEKLRKLK